MHTTFIDAREAALHLDDPDWVFVDCRFTLADTELGRRSYLGAHVPGAVYAHLDEDLCGPIMRGVTGRHPLPTKQRVTEVFSRFGIDINAQVVAYDDLSGQLAAGRLWWMLKWAGHEAVAVLDGGMKRWAALGLPTRAGAEARPARHFTPRFDDAQLASAQEILGNPGLLVLDSRAADRYRGENEIIDPVAGHIPGALSVPFAENIEADGSVSAVGALRKRFAPLAGDRAPGEVVFYCGSGVSAAQNIIAFEHAGLGRPRLYVGSWSDWITDPARPVATGAAP